MTRLGWVVAAVLVVALAAMSVLYATARAEQGSPSYGASAPMRMAQAPGGAPGPFGQWREMSEAERAKMREQRTERMLEQAGLTDKEKAAAKKTMKAKDQARQVLAGELVKLQRTANKATPTPSELQGALSAYRSAMAQYRQKVQAEDRTLVKQLSLMSQMRCTTMGILDNGLGGMGGMGMAGMGRMGMGGAGMPGGRLGGRSPD